MINLNDIDPIRVSDCLNKKIIYRGCGKTTAKMIKLFSCLSHRNANNSYLYVCENNYYVDIIHEQLHLWCTQSGFYSKYNKVFFQDFMPRRFIVDIPHKVPENVMEKIHEFMIPQEKSQIYVSIVTPQYVFKRGVYYNKIILDLSPEQAYKHAINIGRTFKYGTQNG